MYLNTIIVSVVFKYYNKRWYLHKENIFNLIYICIYFLNDLLLLSYTQNFYEI